jgi:hypothetical protein
VEHAAFAMSRPVEPKKNHKSKIKTKKGTMETVSEWGECKKRSKGKRGLCTFVLGDAAEQGGHRCGRLGVVWCVGRRDETVDDVRVDGLE